MTTLVEDAYTDFIQNTWIATLIASLFCISAQLAAFALPLLTPHRFEYFEMKEWRTCLLGAVTLVVMAVLLAWVIQETTAHRDAVDDLMSQFLESMDVFLEASVDDSFKMAKQAANVWALTGSALSNLEELSPWMSPLMQNFYNSSRLQTLRFGTTAGLEQAANGTSVGVRAMSRTLSGTESCLTTYLADGVTNDDVEFPDVCNYDPRYTTWFEHGRNSQKSGVNNTGHNTLHHKYNQPARFTSYRIQPESIRVHSLLSLPFACWWH